MPIAHYPNQIGEAWANMMSGRGAEDYSEMPPEDEGYLSYNELRDELINYLTVLDNDDDRIRIILKLDSWCSDEFYTGDVVRALRTFIKYFLHITEKEIKQNVKRNNS